MKKRLRKKVLFVSLGVICLMLLAGTVIKALLTDTETSANNLVSGTSIDLQVGDQNPSIFGFDFTNMTPNEERVVNSSIQNTGALPGNFWFEVNAHDSDEGENFPAEVDTTGEGELDDCTELKVVFYDDLGNAMTQFEYTPITTLESVQNANANTSIDNLINARATDFDVFVKTGACENDAMGDSFMLDFVFHLDQI
jgi:hypothetical protein